ncbi:hypothetical protein BQ8482_200024 [Mesorhizobium delmotii]|uniref:Uncharacterized protein n=1 Tax=Mesorhizobium delmotii TaxID=1631247 RepID=A0A2P9AKV8_9HYPH|nr:hypothetical protein BQ8482_200024 [Mesorhizobium delmotii]
MKVLHSQCWTRDLCVGDCLSQGGNGLLQRSSTVGRLSRVEPEKGVYARGKSPVQDPVDFRAIRKTVKKTSNY